MKPLFPVLVAALALTSLPAVASEEGEGKRPGFLSRVVNVFRFKKGDDKKQANWRRLELSLTIEPQPLNLSENRLFKAVLQLTNKSKRLVQLEFPTSQRIEVVVKTKAGKLVEQWSEDQAFANEPTLVSINPGERLEYTVSLATRDLQPGETYIVEAFFPNYEPLRTQTTLAPAK